MMFSLGFLLIAITSVRIYITVTEIQYQTVRTVWGTAEMLCATFVSNAPAIYASVKKMNEKKQPLMSV
jgi:hypothetical protein